LGQSVKSRIDWSAPAGNMAIDAEKRGRGGLLPGKNKELRNAVRISTGSRHGPGEIRPGAKSNPRKESDRCVENK